MKQPTSFTNKLKNWGLNVVYRLKKANWVFILLTVITIELSIFMFCYLRYSSIEKIDVNESLTIILTINGLFSAVLVTYFFNRINQILGFKKEHYDEATLHSQKITDFRRVLKKLTEYYGVWYNEKATKNLLDHGEFKNVDYYDFKLMSFSDYKPVDEEVINKIMDHKDYDGAATDLYLGMISLVHDRKSDNILPDEELYADYQLKGVYTAHFVDKCMDIGYFGRLWYWFNQNYDFINYNSLSSKSKLYIKNALGRINSKYMDKPLGNSLMADVCNDMQEYHLKELHQLLNGLKRGISGMTLLIFIILILSLVFGVLFPFFTYFIFEGEVRVISTQVLISINFGLTFFFVVNLYTFVKRELIWA